MLTNNNSDTDWFPAIPAWPDTGSRAARELARELTDRAAEVVSDDRDDVSQRFGAALGWLGLPNALTSESAAAAVEDDLDLTGPSPDVGYGLGFGPGGQAVTIASGRHLLDPLAAGALLVVEDDPVPIESVEAAPRRVRLRRDRQRRRSVIDRAVLGSAAIAVVVVLAYAAVVMLLGDNESGSDGQAVASVVSVSPSVTASVPPAEAECSGRTSDGAVITNDRGDQASGVGVIEAFNYAYYHDRNAVAARAVTVRNAPLATAPEMQKFIDALPTGTTYCLQIADRGAGLFAVKLTETPPTGAPAVWPQLIQTSRAGGKTWIAEIRNAE